MIALTITELNSWSYFKCKHSYTQWNAIVWHYMDANVWCNEEKQCLCLAHKCPVHKWLVEERLAYMPMAGWLTLVANVNDCLAKVLYIRHVQTGSLGLTAAKNVLVYTWHIHGWLYRTHTCIYTVLTPLTSTYQWVHQWLTLQMYCWHLCYYFINNNSKPSGYKRYQLRFIEK